MKIPVASVDFALAMDMGNYPIGVYGMLFVNDAIAFQFSRPEGGLFIYIV
jgi:hypothetical protein